MRKKFLIVLAVIAILIVTFALVIRENSNNSIKILSETKNKFGSVWVFDEEEKRCMTFDKPPVNTTQSCLWLKNPKIILPNYVRGFMGTLFLSDNPQKILVMGLGGANTQSALNILLPKATIDTVEINGDLKPLAEKYFFYKEDERNQIFIDDAMEFARKSEAEKYDIVLIDVFSTDGGYIPNQFLTDEFIQSVKRILKREGVVAMNTFTNGEFSDLESALFKRNFGSYYSLVMGGNRIIIAARADLPDMQEITNRVILWRYRFAEVGISSDTLLQFFGNPL